MDHIGFGISMKGNDFIMDCVYLFYWRCHKINLKSGRSNIDSPDRMKTKKQQ